MKYNPIDARDLLPNGGRDNYTGDHSPFNSVAQIRESDTYDDFMVSPAMNKSDVKSFSRPELCRKSHMYSMYSKDIGASAGVASVEVETSELLKRDI